jgi:4-hydroxybenzoate polyprenyltransferase
MARGYGQAGLSEREIGKANVVQTDFWNTIERSSGWPTQLKYLFLAMRPQQWIKNLLLFMALIFSLNQHWSFENIGHAVYLLGIVTAGFALFCLISSAEYLINDLLDIEADRQHPTKRERPLASGRLNRTLTWTVAILLPVVAIPMSYWLSSATGSGFAFGIVATLYFLLALNYSLFLKKLVIIDVFALAGGFVLRAMAGAVVLGFPISPWLYICTLLLALFLALSKRRHELVSLGSNSGNHRQSLIEYTPKLIDEMIGLVTAATVVSYSLYTFSAENLPKNHTMMLTVPLVLYGIFRYLYLMHVKKMGGSLEEVLLKDKPLIATVFLWVVTGFFILLASPPYLN